MRHTLEENHTIFGQIVRGEEPAKVIYEDDQCLVFWNKFPKAETHILIIPKQHIGGLQDIEPGDEALLGHLLVVANKVAKQLGLQESGYRLFTNAGTGAGQTIPHLHFHIVSGKTVSTI